MSIHYRLTVALEGTLTQTEECWAASGIVRGDILSVERPSPACFKIEIYRELLGAGWDFLHPSARWSFVARFLSLPLTTLDPGGLVRIPPGLFPLTPGTALSVVGDFEAGCHVLRFYREV